jgi:hypothetical protein
MNQELSAYEKRIKSDFFIKRKKDIEQRVICCERYARDFYSGKNISGQCVAKEISKGLLKHPSNFQCVDCGCKATEYDHRDYNKPLNVDPVCRGCNARRGQAAPLDGFIEKMISLNHRPYKYKIHMLRMAKAMGIEITNHESLPKILSIDIWKSLAVQFFSKKAA